MAREWEEIMAAGGPDKDCTGKTLRTHADKVKEPLHGMADPRSSWTKQEIAEADYRAMNRQLKRIVDSRVRRGEKFMYAVFSVMASL